MEKNGKYHAAFNI